MVRKLLHYVLMETVREGKMDRGAQNEEIRDEKLRRLERELELLEQMMYNLQIEKGKLSLRIGRLVTGKDDCQVMRVDIAA
jgi:hypothetical protein